MEARGGRSGDVLRAAWDRGRGLAAFVLLSLVAGSAFLFVKQASSSVPPLTLVSLRLSLGFMALFVLTACFYRDYVPCMFTFKTALQLCFMAVANNVVPYTLYPIAQHYVDTGVAAILASTAPLFALVIGHFAIPGSERMTLLRALAVVVGLGGVVVLSLQKIGSKDGHSYWTFGAYFLVVLAAASKGCASVFAHRYLVDFKIIPLACGQTFFGSLIAISLSLIFDFNIPPFSFPTHYFFFNDLTWKAFWGVIYLGLAASCLAYLLQFYLLQTIGSVKQTFVDFLVPVVALVEGVVILDSWAHVSDWYIVAEVVGACLILCSLGLAHGPSLCGGPVSKETGHDSNKEEDDYSITFNASPSASSGHITGLDTQPTNSLQRSSQQPNSKLLLIT